MQITLDVEKVDSLFLKQEVGTGKIGDDELRFGICLPAGVPYIHLRGAYYNVPEIFQKMLRAVHEPVCLACEGCPVCEANPACCIDCTGGVEEGPVKFCECEGHTCGPAPEDTAPAEMIRQDIEPWRMR